MLFLADDDSSLLSHYVRSELHVSLLEMLQITKMTFKVPRIARAGTMLSAAPEESLEETRLVQAVIHKPF